MATESRRVAAGTALAMGRHAARSPRKETAMETNRTKKKVISPIEVEGGDGKEKRTYWMRVGTAFTNRDGSFNIYLDATPKSMKLHVRDFDERDFQKSPRPEGERNPAAQSDAVPF
jgi:hypothetical protein